ncbi:MAG: N-6 DNA methylase [Planctomycetes bacterium]|nr:N-6 DNA methylase [Planctomycetota bacterium]
MPRIQSSPSNNRRRLGQVFTPRIVADWMTQWVCSNQPRSILEPSLGAGVFVDAIDAQFRDNAMLFKPEVDAYEIDDALVAEYMRRSPSSINVRCIHADFLTAKLPHSYDAVVANPPYIRRHQHDYGEDLFRNFDESSGRRLSRLTNVYGLFLLKIWQSLAAGGRAAVITPAEWLNADFGVPIKTILLEANAIDAILHFGHNSKVFADAMTTAAITLLRRGRKSNDSIRFASVESPDDLSENLLNHAIDYEIDSLDPARKWTSLFDQNGNGTASHGQSKGPTLGDVARCVRGIATGANDYFTLRESDRIRHEIELPDLTPCVTKAQHVVGEVFRSSDIQRLIGDDQRIYLLNPREERSAAVESYLALGREQGIHERYLPSHRPVWYLPEARPPAPIWVSVFARGRFKFVRNDAAALSLTAFHAIYPNRIDAQSVALLFEYLSGDSAQSALIEHRRIYAEGLLKVEPRDVESMPIPESLVAKLKTNLL